MVPMNDCSQASVHFRVNQKLYGEIYDVTPSSFFLQ